MKGLGFGASCIRELTVYPSGYNHVLPGALTKPWRRWVNKSHVYFEKLWYWHNKTKHNKTVCLFHEIFSMFSWAILYVFKRYSLCFHEIFSMFSWDILYVEGPVCWCWDTFQSCNIDINSDGPGTSKLAQLSVNVHKSLDVWKDMPIS